MNCEEERDVYVIGTRQKSCANFALLIERELTKFHLVIPSARRPSYFIFSGIFSGDSSSSRGVFGILRLPLNAAAVHVGARTTRRKLNMRSFLSLNHQRVLKCKEQNSDEHQTLFRVARIQREKERERERSSVRSVGSEGEIRAGEGPARERKRTEVNKKKGETG